MGVNGRAISAHPSNMENLHPQHPHHCIIPNVSLSESRVFFLFPFFFFHFSFFIFGPRWSGRVPLGSCSEPMIDRGRSMAMGLIPEGTSPLAATMIPLEGSRTVTADTHDAHCVSTFSTRADADKV